MTIATIRTADDVRDVIRGRNLVRLEWVRRQLQAAAGADVDPAPVADLHAALATAGDTAAPVLVDPRFGRWLTQLVTLIDRRAQHLMPHGAFRSGCQQAGAAAAAVRLLGHRSGERAQVAETRVRIGADGRTPLPGAGLVIVAPLHLSGLPALVRTRGRELPSVTVPGAARARTATLIEESWPVGGLAVPASDHVDRTACRADPLLAAGPPAVLVERGAVNLRRASVPGIAVVPLEASVGVRTAHALAASAHLKLLLSCDTAGGSPPLALRTAAPPHLAEVCYPDQIQRLLALRAALHELRVPGVSAVEQVIAAVGEWLAAAGDRTPDGDDIAASLRRQGLLRRRRVRRDPRPGRSRAHPDWYASWLRAGGRPGDPGVSTRRFEAGASGLSPVLEELGCPSGIEVNVLDDQRLRADPSIDHLSLMSVREPARYAALVGRIDAARDCDARQLLRGHCAYVQQQFVTAVTAYAALLARHPHDADLWRDLTFALRHLGAPDLAETWVFHPQEVIARATACHPQAAPFDQLLPFAPPRWNGQETTRFTIGVLEWVRHDLDHR
jgi:hypothetical protein